MPAGRHYPSEHQDWEPPHWPDGILPAEDPGRHSGWERPERPQPNVIAEDPGPGLPPDPGPYPDSELPPDPFPDWHQFTATELDNSGWPEPIEDPYPECLLLQSA